MNDEQAARLRERGESAAVVLACHCLDMGSDGCRIPVTVEGCNFMVSVTKMEAAINED